MNLIVLEVVHVFGYFIKFSVKTVFEETQVQSCNYLSSTCSYVASYGIVEYTSI